MVGRLICCWIASCHADFEQAERPERGSESDDRLQRYVDRRYRRFLQACKGLATVSRLLGPNVQVNIADRQQVANV